MITLTYLLQGKDGWYVISSGWNNPVAPVDEGLFFSLINGVISATGK